MTLADGRARHGSRSRWIIMRLWRVRIRHHGDAVAPELRAPLELRLDDPLTARAAEDREPATARRHADPIRDGVARGLVGLMHEQGAPPPSAAVSEHEVEVVIIRSQGKGQPVSVTDVVGEESPNVESRCRIAGADHQSERSTVVGGGPEELEVGPAPRQVEQRRGAVCRTECRLVEAPAHARLMVRVRVPLSAYVLDPVSLHPSAHAESARLILGRPGEEQRPKDRLLGGRSPGSRLAPVTVPMPRDEADEGIVELVDEAPDPVVPEGLEPVHGGTPDARPPAHEMGTEVRKQLARRLLVDPPIELEGHAGADPLAV